MRKTLLTHSLEIKNEADNLLKSIDLQNLLQKYGSCKLIGSYSYNVMLKRDLDFHVLVAKFEENLPIQIFSDLLKKGFFEQINFHNKHEFNKEAANRYLSKVALDSYFFDLKTWFNSYEWSIGISFIDMPQSIIVEMDRLFQNFTESQREKILEFKKHFIDRKLKVSSSHIYKAVLEHDIVSIENLYKYLQSFGYSL